VAAPARAGRDRALSRGIGRATEPRRPRAAGLGPFGLRSLGPVGDRLFSGVLSSRQQGHKLEVIDLIRLPPLFVISLVRPRRRLSLAPTGRMLTPSRTQGVSRLAALAATVRLGLDTTEHDGTPVRSGLLFPIFGLLQYWTLPSCLRGRGAEGLGDHGGEEAQALLCPERDQQMTPGRRDPSAPEETMSRHQRARCGELEGCSDDDQAMGWGLCRSRRGAFGGPPRHGVIPRRLSWHA